MRPLTNGFYDHSAHLQLLITLTGFFQLGPASVEAVRKGQVGLSYDVTFVLSEVNAGT